MTMQMPMIPDPPSPSPVRDDAVVAPALPVEIDRQVATARAYPRDVRRAIREAVDLATLDDETAASCVYALERKSRGGGVRYIRGPTVRLAEILASTWGHLRIETVEDDVVGTGRRTMVQAAATVWDLEKNIAVRVVARRRAVDRDGVPYSEDMLATTTAACASIAFRNALFRVIPRAYVHHVYLAAEARAMGSATSLAEQRAKAVEYFRRWHVSQDRVLAALGRRTLEEVTADDLAKLRAIAASLQRGERTVDECFPPPTPEAPAAPEAPTSPTSGDVAESPADRVIRTLRRRTRSAHMSHAPTPTQ